MDLFKLCLSITLLSSVLVKTSGKQLLVLAPPIKDNEYYKNKFFEVIPFYINYANNVTGHDDVVLIADEKTITHYRGKVDESKLIMAHIDDPWVRDVSPPIPSSNIQFTYIGGASKSEAKHTQTVYDDFLSKIGITIRKTTLYLDGGNLVNNNLDKVITTKKFLTDNNLTEDEGVQKLQDLLNVKNVSILTPDDPVLGHSDGMAAYVCENTIYMQTYDGNSVKEVLYKSELRKGCPDCDIIEVEGFFDNRTYEGGYASSCGVYVNCVVTDDFIYMPMFMHEKDEAAIQKFENNPCGKKVIPIDVRTVCEMGGSLRCLSWQTSGVMAEKLQKIASSEGRVVVSITLLLMVMFFYTIIL